MPKNNLIVVLLIVLAGYNLTIVKPTDAAISDAWTTKAPMATPRYNLGVAVVNDKIYAIGGRGGDDVFSAGALATNEMYDPTSDTWTAKAPMPTARFYFGIAVFNGKIYVFGGQSGYNMSGSGEPILCPSTEVYDPTTDSWETKAPMPTPRTQLQANPVNGGIYLIGGIPAESSTYSTNINEMYDPEKNTWLVKAPMPLREGAYGYASAVANSKIYIIGSFTYDPSTDSWSEGIHIPSRNVIASTTIASENKIYAFGIQSTNIYNLNNNSWTLGSSAPTSANSFALAGVGNALYTIGGFYGNVLMGNYNATGLNEQYTPWLDKPTTVSSTPISPSYPSPTIPELSSSAILALFLFLLTIAVITRHQKRH